MREINFNKYWYNILLCLVILLGILLRLKGLLINPSLWHDECALAWNIKFKSYPELFGILRFMQVAPPFFTIATKFLTGIFGYSEIVLRFIPFITGCLSIVAFYFLASKTFNLKSTTLWAVFFFAVNQRLINYSFELKHYGIDVFFTIICLLFFVNLNIEKLDIKKVVFYGILLALIPWCSFVAVFIIIGGFLNLFFKNIKSNLEKKTVLILPILISGLIYLKIYLFANYTGAHMVVGWHDYFVTANPLSIFQLIIESVRYLFYPIDYVLFFLILFIWGIIILYKEKSSFINVAIAGFIVFIIASFLHIYPFFGRVILFLTPIYLLLVIKPLDLVSFDKKFKLCIILFLTFFTLWPQITQADHLARVKSISRGEYPREMMDFMMKNIKKDDIIFVNKQSNIEFIYYSSFYNIKNNVIYETVTNEAAKKYIPFLNTLRRGYYWFYLPYDSQDASVFQYILPWAATKKIFYSYRNNKSILMYVYIE